jgi:prepilin-type N-terminal cleavage/methylation domain-containing protein
MSLHKVFSLRNKNHLQRGFTLGELLVVMLVLGLLTAVVFGSILTSRQKARDARRIADMKEIELGLALYFDVNKVYPVAVSTLAEQSQRFLPSIPTDPQTGLDYEYLTSNANTRYCIGVTLETIVPNDTVNCTSQISGSTANYKAQR